MTISEQPKGKSMRELHKLVAQDQARWETLAGYWNNLTIEEQITLLKTAEMMANQ